MSRITFWVSLFVFVCIHASAQTWGSPVWQDEFNGTAGTPIDSTKWTYDTGNLNVNNELEIYCAPTSNTAPCDSANPNASIDGSGHLAIQHRLIGSLGTGTWTSARLKTQGVHTFQYGRIESRLQIPSHQGIWPAFWMLGANIDTVNWPDCGEVDIMENWPGIGATQNATSMHGNGYSGGNSLTSTFTFPNGERVDTGFHTYGIIWSQNMMQFYFDDPSNITFVRTAADVPPGKTWPFNNPFFLITNMAIGGVLGGDPDSGTASAGTMLVDYVRYYQPATIAGPTMNAGGVTLHAGSSGNSTLSLNSASGTGLVYLECTGAPTKSTCTIDTGNSINSHVVDFSSSSTGQATVHITTTANTAKALPFKKRSYWLAITVPVLFGLVLLPLAKRSSRHNVALILGIFFSFAALPSCGGGGTSGGGGGGGGTGGTPTGHYNLTVTAYTVSGNTSTATISLDVN